MFKELKKIINKFHEIQKPYVKHAAAVNDILSTVATEFSKENKHL